MSGFWGCRWWLHSRGHPQEFEAALLERRRLRLQREGGVAVGDLHRVRRQRPEVGEQRAEAVHRQVVVGPLAAGLGDRGLGAARLGEEDGPQGRQTAEEHFAEPHAVVGLGS